MLFLNGTWIGKAKGIHKITAGRFRLTVKKDGYDADEKDLLFKPGEFGKFIFKMREKQR